jgi:hypothetical protein
MPILDVFNSDAFTAVSLTAAVDKYGYVPGFLSARPGLIVPVPVRTKEVWIEERANTPALIQTTARGAPPVQKSGDIRDARSWATVRLAIASRIWAEEVQSIRVFGQEQAMKDLQGEVARRQFKMKQDLSLTRENMVLGLVQGIVTDADGSTIRNWATEFGQSLPAEASWNTQLNATSGGALREACNTVRRGMLRALKGLGGVNVRIEAICDDVFWDDFVTSEEVRDNYQAAAALQRINNVGNAFESYTFAGITFHNYRGTDDNSTVALGSGKCKFYPVDAGIFQIAYSPAARMEFINTMGQAEYSWIVADMLRDEWADVEMQSYLLPVCTMPSALYSARSAA